MDYKLAQGKEGWDLVKGEYDLKLEDGLYSAIIVSLFTEPGWWGNAYLERKGDAYGCKLSEACRASLGQATLQRLEDECMRALSWMVQDGIARNVAVSARKKGDNVSLTITVDNRPIELEVT